MRISDWSSDVCSSDLTKVTIPVMAVVPRHLTGQTRTEAVCYRSADRTLGDDFIIGAILDISISGRRIRRLDRNEMHQSRGGVLSEHRTLWTTQDLNALDIDRKSTRLNSSH